MKFDYEFLFDDGRKECFHLTISDRTLTLDPLPLDYDAEWIRLGCHQCPGCSLAAAQHPYCPVARNLAQVLPKFVNDLSYTTVLARVTTANRVMEKKGPLETCVSSIMGLIMATSGCPVLDVLKPMAFTHLPFANEDETMFRAVSSYLIGQYIRMLNGMKPDWDVKNLGALYKGISALNAEFTERLRSMKGKDANVTALISLDLFAQFGTFALPETWAGSVREFFSAYLREE